MALTVLIKITLMLYQVYTNLVRSVCTNDTDMENNVLSIVYNTRKKYKKVFLI